MTRQYTSSVPFKGDAAKVFDWALGVLTPLGFQTVERKESSLEVVGSGMRIPRQNPLAGASRIQLSHDDDELTVTAELGGVERVTRFLAVFPQVVLQILALVFIVVFGLVLRMEGWALPAAIVVGGNAILWLILAPLIGRAFRKRTCEGLDALVQNMATIGQQTG